MLQDAGLLGIRPMLRLLTTLPGRDGAADNAMPRHLGLQKGLGATRRVQDGQVLHASVQTVHVHGSSSLLPNRVLHGLQRPMLHNLPASRRAVTMRLAGAEVGVDRHSQRDSATSNAGTARIQLA